MLIVSDTRSFMGPQSPLPGSKTPSASSPQQARTAGGSPKPAAATDTPVRKSWEMNQPRLNFPRSLHSHAALLELYAGPEIDHLGLYVDARVPYFFLGKKGYKARPLSGFLSPARMPRATPESFAGLHLPLYGPHSYWLCYLDPTLGRVVKLQMWRDHISSDALRAVLSCLLRVGPFPCRNPNEALLTSLTVAAVCFEAGFVVRRDAGTAARLRADIPERARHRALRAARRYVEAYDLLELKDYLPDVHHFFDDSARAAALEIRVPPWAKPWRWPGMAADAIGRLAHLAVSDSP